MRYITELRKPTNDIGTSIKERIDSGKTLLFNNEILARNKAIQMRSYHYTVYQDELTTGYYAVPK